MFEYNDDEVTFLITFRLFFDFSFYFYRIRLIMYYILGLIYINSLCHFIMIRLIKLNSFLTLLSHHISPFIPFSSFPFHSVQIIPSPLLSFRLFSLSVVFYYDCCCSFVLTEPDPTLSYPTSCAVLCCSVLLCAVLKQ